MRRLLLAVIVIALAVAPAWSSSEKKPGVRSEMLVTTAWLAEHLNDPNVVILQVGFTPEDYNSGHIPGARYLDTRKIALNDPPGSELLPVEQLKAAFEAVGVTDKTRIVLYTSEYQPSAARAWYTLDYLGHGDHAALLNGGFEQWLKENRPLSTETPTVQPGSLTPKVRSDVKALYDEVKKATEDGSAVLLDSRPMRRYRMGHPAGSQPMYWETLLVSEKDPVLKSEAELRKQFVAAGAKPGSKVISYCEVGNQASFVYFVARYLGYDARNYDGSFSEWWGQKKTEVVRGDSPRAAQPK